jgi:uncharacterized low-complexity protein
MKKSTLLVSLGAAAFLVGVAGCASSEKKPDASATAKAAEGSCGGEKKAEGSCGGDKKAEGSCGGEKKAGEGSCGEGSCGGDKPK